jgi:hypothetical protein
LDQVEDGVIEPSALASMGSRPGAMDLGILVRVAGRKMEKD